MPLIRVRKKVVLASRATSIVVFVSLLFLTVTLCLFFPMHYCRFWMFKLCSCAVELLLLLLTMHVHLMYTYIYCRWSCSDGARWTGYSYSDTTILVVRMLTERGEKAQHATVFGYHPYSYPFEWLVIDLDFATGVIWLIGYVVH